MRYLTGLRLARAARLLRSTDATVAEIARLVGYASEEALSRAFKARFGNAPSVFRRRVLATVARASTDGIARPTLQVSRTDSSSML
jgi:transcriptional regulator GlxA family with amidase domain